MEKGKRTYRILKGTAIMLLSLWYAFPCRGQQYKVIDYGENHQLPQPYVYSLSQDRSGRLWIGTGEGLSRFNGNSFEIFTVSDSLGDNFILTSHINDLGVWFGHMNGGISLNDGTSFMKLVQGEQGTGSITDIKTLDNTTWASTQSGGIWRIDSSLEPVLYEDKNEPPSIFAFEMLSSTECLVGAMDGVYFYSLEHESSELRLIGTLEGLPDTKIQDMVLSSDNEILYILTMDEGIYLYNTSDYTMKAEALGWDRDAEIEGPQQLYEDSEMNLWVPTFGNGLYKLIREENGQFTSWINFSERNGLPGDNVKCVMEDREHNIWLGMFGSGLARLVDDSYASYFLDDIGFENKFHSIYVNQQYGWFGTEQGLIRLDLNHGDITMISGPEYGLPEDRVTAIAGSSEGELWVGTSRNGVFRWDTELLRFDTIHISSGILENNIHALQLHEKILWIATERGVCKRNTVSGQVKWFTISNGLPFNSVKNLMIDESGRVWLSTLSNAPTYIEDDSVGRVTSPKLDSPLNITCTWLDLEGNIWLGTSGSGVWKFSGDSVVNFTSEDGLVSDYCLSIMCDDSRYIWISHRQGLSKIRTEDGHIKKNQEEFGIEQNMEFNPNASFMDASGVLWFGSSNGVLSYNPATHKNEAPPPLLSITSISVNDIQIDPQNRLKLRPGRYDLRIDFLGLNLKNPEGVSYRYKMEGLGGDWSGAFDDSHVLFNKLPDGRYTFQLSSMNSDGVVTLEPLKYSILIAKPIWKHWWFYVLAMIVLLSLLAAYIKRREYYLRQDKIRLEKAVQDRTAEVVLQKEEIEQQHDAIKDQNNKIRQINTQMTESITYARHIQRAVFPPEEHLKQLFKESFIFSRPKDIVSGDFYWVGRHSSKQVVTVADCTGHGVPGAFMSMLGITLLNDLVTTRRILEADKILNILKDEIIRALRQKGRFDDASDGMDMALCVFDREQSTLQYAGGLNPLILVRDQELTMIKADPMPIGIGAITGREFTLHEMEIRKGDVIYLYSDGFEDQFGGERDKKFSRKRFRKLLLEIHGLTMPEQKRTLESTIDEWMDGREQIDDITVLGIRF